MMELLGLEFVMHRDAQISGEMRIFWWKFPSTKSPLPTLQCKFHVEASPSERG